MSDLFRNAANTFGSVVTVVLVIALALFIPIGAQTSRAQETKAAQDLPKSGSNAGLIARGKYIVDGVAHCGDCHTPRNANNEPDSTRVLAGAPVPYLSARPASDWPIMAPRLAGTPPANDAAMITLLMTGIWVDGKPLRSPMPRFYMTRSDAEAVLAYLKSISTAH